MKKILVPTDFSPLSKAAAKVACDIVREQGGEIHLVHMLEIPVETIDPAGISTFSGPNPIFYLEQTKRQFDLFASDPIFDGITVVENLQFSETFSGIIKGATDNEIDLIVMGSKGCTGLNEMLIGSNTEKVVRLSPIPVLVIKREIDHFFPKKILFASDFDKECIPVLKKLEKIANTYSAKIEVVRINTVNNFETTEQSELKIAEFLKETGIKVNASHIYNDKSVEHGILHFAQKNNFDLIALTTHGRRGLSHLFNGSIGEDLVNHALRPVITFKI